MLGWSFIRSTMLITRILIFGQMLAKNRDSGENFERGCISAAGHHHVRRARLVVARPLPNADTFRAMHDRLIHRQPLR